MILFSDPFTVGSKVVHARALVGDSSAGSVLAYGAAGRGSILRGDVNHHIYSGPRGQAWTVSEGVLRSR
jgi:hypothetical protein